MAKFLAIIGAANLFIALFIMVYAGIFLLTTKSHRERRPWDLLFIASITYLIFQLTSNFMAWGVVDIQGIDVATLSSIFEFIYSGLILLSIVAQHDLIVNSHLITIIRRPKREKE